MRKRGAYRLFQLERWAYACIHKGLAMRNPSLMRHAARFLDMLAMADADYLPEVTPFQS